MALDPRTPVIVGVAQTLRRPPDPATAAAPVDMMADALRVAADDSGAGPRLLGRADSVRVPALLSWRYSDPGALVAERLGISPRDTVITTTGGNSPQLLLNDTALAVQRGDVDVALMVGAEAMYTRLRARKVKAWLDWEPQPDAVPSQALGDERPGVSDAEMARSIVLPIQVYPVFENALRAAAGESIEDHQRKVASLWARFSEVAAANPHAWSREARTADDIATVTADNRWIGFPYTKAMNANLDTDQSAAVIMCSVEAARAVGVPEERWVFPWSGADAHDHWFVSERADLRSSPAIRMAGRAALEPHTTEIAGFDPGHFHIVLINNSCLSWEQRERGMLGVLHKAIIPHPDPSASRFINSLVLTRLAGGEEPRIGPDKLQEFIATGSTVLG